MNKNICIRINSVALWLLLLISANAFTAPSPHSVDALIERATQLKLAEKPAWLNLLHYKETFSGLIESQADDTDFFLASQGSSDAQAELAADLRGFFSLQSSDHPQCLFPARLHWLNTQLNFNQQLPEVDCPKLNDWKQKLKATQLTLLFPSMYLQNPASMFGHTFLRFDQPQENPLLSYTLSYAAAHDGTDSALVYAWKGVSGGYSGRFYLQAYFETLQEYSDIEQRDIWEYPLNLNQQEIDQLIRHLWEVSGIHFEYYFFRENCSFRLLALLDVATENVNLSLNTHPLYALPVDIVRDIDNAGLIKNRYYRPATHNKIKQMWSQLSDDARQVAIKLTENETPLNENSQPFSVTEQIQIYQLANEILNRNKNLSTEQQSLQLELLSALSHLPVTEPSVEINYKATPPEQSHPSARWQLSAGEREQQTFYEMGIRPVFHDLLDAPQGFIDGASIVVLDTRLRWYQQQEKLSLQRLTFFSMQSILAVKPWATPLSRKLSLQIKQRDISTDQQITEFESQFAMGYAAELRNVLMYAMAKGQLDYATELKNNHALYLGVDMGLLWQFDNRFISGQTEANYQLLQQVSGEEGDIQRLNLGVQFSILKRHALRFEYEIMNYEQFEVEEWKLSYLNYF